MKQSNFFKTILKDYYENAEVDLCVKLTSYSYGGGLAAVAYSKANEQVDVLTVNLEFPLDDKEIACIDVNNVPWAEKFLKDNGLAEPTGYALPSGFCMYPVYKFNLDKFQEVKE